MTELRPDPEEIGRWTDTYFRKTKGVVGKFGDVRATYAIFMRRPVVFTPRMAVEWLRAVARHRETEFDIDLRHEEGDWVGAGDPLMYLSGSLYHLIDLETIYLQKLGAACVAAYNAYAMCRDLPKVGFLAMDARHAAGADMAELMAYAASVGSQAARREVGAVGFVGNATDATAHYFGQERGLGTMPHALIGYAGSTLRAAEMFHETFPDENLTVLVDYYGQEITDALAVSQRFPELARTGRLAFRLDTHGGRYCDRTARRPAKNSRRRLSGQQGPDVQAKAKGRSRDGRRRIAGRRVPRHRHPAGTRSNSLLETHPKKILTMLA
jgi:nicotinate phosphoribosyltransferase